MTVARVLRPSIEPSCRRLHYGASAAPEHRQRVCASSCAQFGAQGPHKNPRKTRRGRATKAYGSGVALLLWCATAAAQTDAERAEAQKRYQEGVALHDKGRDDEAHTRFAQAYAILPSPATLFNLARTEQLTGHLAEASRHWRAYLAAADDGRITEATRAKAAAFLAEIQPKIGHLALEAPAGAAITVDGDDVPTGTLDVEPGTHTVAGRLEHETRTVTVTAVAGETTLAELVFDAIPPPAGPTTGFAALQATPPAERTFHYEMSGAKGTTLIALGAGIAAALTIGIGLEVASAGYDSDAQSDRRAFPPMAVKTGSECTMTPSSPACVALRNAVDSSVTDANAAVGMFVGTGVLTAAGIVTWIVWPKRRVEDAGLVVPIVSARMVGLGWASFF